MENIKIPFALIAFLSLCYMTEAAIYTKVLSTTSLDGYDDCRIVEYGLFEDYNNDDPLDDKMIGKYAVLVGSGCVSGFGSWHPESEPERNAVKAPEVVSWFTVSPNPSQGLVKVKYLGPERQEKTWDWSLLYNEAVVLSGRSVLLRENHEFGIDIPDPRPGKYTLIMHGNREIFFSNIMVIP